MFCEAATGRQLERVATRVSAGIVRPEFGKRKTADGIGTAPSQEGATLEAFVVLVCGTRLSASLE